MRDLTTTLREDRFSVSAMIDEQERLVEALGYPRSAVVFFTEGTRQGRMDHVAAVGVRMALRENLIVVVGRKKYKAGTYGFFQTKILLVPEADHEDVNTRIAFDLWMLREGAS